MSHFTVRSHDLHMLLKTVLPFASKDPTIPPLVTVKLERHDDQLIAIATDRFRIGMVRVGIEEYSGDFDVLVGLEQIKAAVPILRITAQRDREWQRVTVAIGDDGEVQWIRTDGTSGRWQNVAGDYSFPKFAQLIPPATDPVETNPQRSTFACTPSYLMDFLKAAWTDRDAVVIEAGETSTRPVTVRVGHHLIGLVMPVRTGGTDYDPWEARKYWESLLTEMRT